MFCAQSYSPNSFSCRGSYFKLVGEGSQILWIRCGGLSHRVSLEVSSGAGFADPRPGQKGCRWRRCVVCVGVRVRRSKTRQSHRCVRVRVRRSKTGLSHRVSLEVLCGVWRGQGSQIQDGAVTQGVVGGVVWCV